MNVPRRRRKPPLDPLSLKRRVLALVYRQHPEPRWCSWSPPDVSPDGQDLALLARSYMDSFLLVFNWHDLLDAGSR